MVISCINFERNVSGHVLAHLIVDGHINNYHGKLCSADGTM